MAKKVRTPPPPRRVQAPQRRDTRKPRVPAAGGTGRPPWLYAALGAAAVILVAAVIGGVVLLMNDSGGTKTTAATNYNTLPGIRRTKAPWPWPPEYQYLADRLAPLGLTTLAGHNGLLEHYHAHLDVFVDGKRVKVPALIGINPAAGYLTELHTHDARGVVHIEAEKKQDYNLGQFIAEWGVFLNSRCLGGHCNRLRWYVNGERQTGNPAGLVLKPHQEIAIVLGKPPANIPSSYKFSPGE